ncbi:MAG: hypothetical protein NTY77_13930 [Elusimicrobia bacterium]|nr:hypothetical protein [Elusimicrobiota bacterium]
MNENSFFERNTKTTIIGFLAVAIICSVVATELILRRFMGLGNPPLYDSSPFYGYRLLPNQKIKRFHGAEIKVNNLGLRAQADWQGDVKNKVLFLGDSVAYGGSYIDNSELFAVLAVGTIAGHVGGDAGVNGWGIENIHGLVVGTHFTPASTYVTVVTEGDFYRGLTRMSGLPFFNKKPTCALEEVILFLTNEIDNNRRYVEWQSFASQHEQEAVVEKAVIKLQEMDEFLKKRKSKHLIFISPSRAQVLHGDSKEPLVRQMLEKHGIKTIYILDKLAKMPAVRQAAIFYDSIHLTKEGHRVWADIIGLELREVLNPRGSP